jgi:purine-binding chemotaxis protein CheW
MAEPTPDAAVPATLELVTFYLEDIIYGIDINKVLGINKVQDLTPVALAPAYIRGLLNLRGQIISIIDLRIKLGLPPSRLAGKSRVIIVNSNGEDIGLLVDMIYDVIVTERSNIEKTPPNLDKLQGKFFEGVVKSEDRLIGIIQIDAVLQMAA